MSSWSDTEATTREQTADGKFSLSANSGGVERLEKAARQRARSHHEGTFYQDCRRVFWDVHDPETTVTIDLHHERYSRLIVEVADPEAAIKLIQSAL